jgi:CheY-like chemotaxis protein
MRLIWLIDDTEDHHAVVATTVARAGCTYEGFRSGHEALATYQERLAGGDLPQIVLMDFFLSASEERGDQVTEALRSLQRAGHRPLVVGFSSVRAASERIVEAGGDLILPKRGGRDGINHDLLRFLTA